MLFCSGPQTPGNSQGLHGLKMTGCLIPQALLTTGYREELAVLFTMNNHSCSLYACSWWFHLVLFYTKGMRRKERREKNRKKESEERRKINLTDVKEGAVHVRRMYCSAVMS